jgi:hypothetical protein
MNRQRRNAGILRCAQNDKQEQAKTKYGDSGYAIMTSVVGWIEENKDEVRELCGRKGRAVGEGRDLSGSFALERRAQDDSKN